MVNNFEKIRNLLEFRSNDDFYFLQILQRKKDAKEGTKVNGTNNNSRLIKAYYINSVEELDFVEPEIIELCKVFNARAGIALNRRSFRTSALLHLQKAADQILNEDYDNACSAYNTVVGKHINENDKIWIVDIDVNDETFVKQMIELIESLPPFGRKKEIATLPSRNGFHLITRPFRVDTYKEYMETNKELYPEIPSIHKNNPTNLYSV